MLGARTKQLYTYGKRGRRTVALDRPTPAAQPDTDSDSDSASAAAPDTPPRARLIPPSRARRENSPPRPPRSPPRPAPRRSKVQFHSSPRGKAVQRVRERERAPLADVPPNVPPTLVRSGAGDVRKAGKAVGVDIVVLDGKGRTVSEEHRTTRGEVEVPLVVRAGERRVSKMRRAPARVVDSEEDNVPEKHKGKARNARRAIPLDSSDEEPQANPTHKPSHPSPSRPSALSDDEDPTDPPPRRKPTARKSRAAPVVLSSSSSSSASSSEYAPSPPPPKPPKRNGARPGVVDSDSDTTPPSPSTSGRKSAGAKTLSAKAVVQAPRVSAVSSKSVASAPSKGTMLSAAHAKPAKPTKPFARVPPRTSTPPPRPAPPRARRLTPTIPRSDYTPSVELSSDSDVELVDDFSALVLDSDVEEIIPAPSTKSKENGAAARPCATKEDDKKEALLQTQPAYLRELLAACGQTAPHDFTAFIERFMNDPLVLASSSAPADFDKIGEASYSEVFRIGALVLKVIPLSSPSSSSSTDTPPPSPASSVLRELTSTRTLGAAHPSFVRVLRAAVVRGAYPRRLLERWDTYAARRGSESVRPGGFGSAQAYAVVCLPHGGADLEAVDLKGKEGWRRAAGVFWQVVRAVGEAEGRWRFEHRDLHWGQVLVRAVDPPAKSAKRPSAAGAPGMDDPACGVQVTIIDLGLARMDDERGAPRWAPFDEETFESEGDYQFDVYRMMRAHIGADWSTYRPLTNVMWLHYLVRKLLHNKGLRRPAGRKPSTPAGPAERGTERAACDCLVEVEAALGALLEAHSAVAAKKSGKKKAGGGAQVGAPWAGLEGVVGCAGDVWRYGVARGWVDGA